MSDIAQALTNSVDRDGRGGMRAPLEMGGNRIRSIAPGSLDTDAVAMSQIGAINAAIAAVAAGALPVGTVLDFAGSAAPANFAFCYGQELTRADYAPLFATIGTTYGAGDGSTTFNLPDARGRVIAGKDDMGGTASGRLTSISSALGSSGGAQTHTLTVGQMPSHTHDMLGFSGARNNAGGAAGTSDVGTANTNFTQSAGGDQPHNNVQPTLILNVIIKVKAS